MKEQFVDQVKIYVRAGKGGDGLVHFRREKFVPRGGPDGGDGGDGGSVYLVGDRNLWHLLDLRYQRQYIAEDGKPGKPKKMHGRRGKDVFIRVPLGTVAYDAETGELIGEILEHGQKLLIARGGKGGRGNARFATPENRAPRYAERGKPGEERWVLLELKTLGDVGIIGFPNAGKSTLLRAITRSRAKVGDYPFTTKRPNLGVVRREFFTFTLVDLPGLVEGAHRGKGMGHHFLRHAERTKALLFLLDPTQGDPEEQYFKLKEELERYSPEMLLKERVIAVNKIDAYEGPLPDEIDGLPVYKISALTGEGVPELIDALLEIVKAPKPEPGSEGSAS